MLRDADASMRTLLEEIFDGQGLALKSFNEFEAAGIPLGATVFVLARKPDFNPPFFGTEKLIARLRQVSRAIASDAEAKIWFTQLWFILLDLLYTPQKPWSKRLAGLGGNKLRQRYFYRCGKGIHKR